MSTYDAIVVGARCAGSPTAMLLARQGYRVLVVDRSHFPSDTISTHVLHPMGVAALTRWGLLDRLRATGCPPVDTYAFDFGAFTLSGSPGTPESPVAYCPRRTVLDKLLVDAASEAGAEMREDFVVEDLVWDEERVVGIQGRTKEGARTTERAKIVIGADGRHSLVAKSVQPQHYRERSPVLAPYYTYWSGLPMSGRFETYIRSHRGFAAIETHDGLTMTVGGWPHSEFEANKGDIERHFLAMLDLVPSFGERIREAKREAPFMGFPTSGYFRKPYGPGWILVGDASYNRDPITAQGITDAFRDAELCARALDRSLGSGSSLDQEMSEVQRRRDEHVIPMDEFTWQLATLEPPPPHVQQIFQAAHGNPEAMTRFVQMNAGTISPAEFFSPESVSAIMAASGSR